HEILAQHVDQAGAHDARVPTGAQDTQRQGGKYQMGKSPVAAHRQPAKPNAENVEQKNPDDELWRGDQRERRDHDDAIEELVAAGRGNQPKTDADQDFKEDGAGNQCERRRQAGEDQLGYLTLLLIRTAEIAVEKTAEVMQVALMKGQVQAELL